LLPPGSSMGFWQLPRQKPGFFEKPGFFNVRDAKNSDCSLTIW
jgi:hypothetical protein